MKHLRATVVAGFADSEAFLRAVDSVQGNGEWHLRTYSPFPLEAVEEKLALKPSPIPKIVFAAFVLGAAGGYGMQVYASVFSYPLNIGGRPLHSWPAFIPVTFELGVLTAALVGLAALFIRRRWPQLHVPELDSPLIARSSLDRFVLSIQPHDESVGADRLEPARQKLLDLGAVETEVHAP